MINHFNELKFEPTIASEDILSMLADYFDRIDRQLPTISIDN